MLRSVFDFHPLALEDCLGRLQRPKLDHYDGYTFFALHSICHEDLNAEELNLFLGENFIVSFHYTHLQEIDNAREMIVQNPNKWERGNILVTYEIFDKIVDQYFPILYNIEDHLDDIEEKLSPTTVQLSMEYVFDVRGDLLRLRRSILSNEGTAVQDARVEKIKVHTSRADVLLGYLRSPHSDNRNDRFQSAADV